MTTVKAYYPDKHTPKYKVSSACPNHLHNYYNEEFEMISVILLFTLTFLVLFEFQSQLHNFSLFHSPLLFDFSKSRFEE